MGSKKNKLARAPASARRKLRLEINQRRKEEIEHQSELERLRVLRAAQKRKYHRAWRARTRKTRDEVTEQEDIGSGAGPAGDYSREEHNTSEHEVLKSPLRDQEVESAGNETSGGMSDEENILLTPGTDFTADEGEDSDRGRVTRARNRKCRIAAERGVSYLMQLLEAGFTDEEKKLVLHLFFADERIRALDPELSTTVLLMKVCKSC
ncbi:hypothetical protein KC19_3G213300 [Ceratodon purpureus]|uniref:Uncharacterized protein n=1 Tax=Ceratodon purpureus TaxID=3225 RepID=A0A8T0INT4_CERPU|nr:hypothetical protein KC19_3G213300 [Ceratodon purpureus]